MEFSLALANNQVSEIQDFLKNRIRDELTPQEIKELCRDLATIRQVLNIVSFRNENLERANALKERCTRIIELYKPPTAT